MSSLSLKIDWLTFTMQNDSFTSDYPETQVEDVIVNVLKIPFDVFVPSRPVQGVYSRSLSFGSIHVDYDAKATVTNTGVCVTMTGTGCSDFLSYSEWSSLPSFLVFCQTDSQYGKGFNCSRLDVAIDEVAGIDEDMDLDMLRIRDCVDYDSFISGGRCSSSISPGTIINSRNGKNRCITCYIGSLKCSTGFVRFYDKAGEQGITDCKITRVEQVLRRGYANDFIAYLCEGRSFVSIAHDFLSDKVRFINRDYSDKYDCTICQWWVSFLERVSKEETQEIVHTKRPQSTVVYRLLNWVCSQVASSLTILDHCFGRDVLIQIFARSNWQLTDKQRAIIQQFRASPSADYSAYSYG